MPVKLALCAEGKMMYRPNDRYVGRSLDYYGEFSAGEVELFERVITKEMVAVDVGANIGAHTVVFSRLARGVVAFEPVRHNFQMLCGNLAVNDCRNVFTYQMAVGDKACVLPVPLLDLDAEVNNYGSSQLEEAPRPGSAYEPVPCGTLDDIVTTAHFIKIDVERMEEKVLRGSLGLIAHCRPLLYIEDDQIDLHEALAGLLLDLDYIPVWHMPMLSRVNNFRKKSDDIFPGLASFNLFCVPKEKWDAYPIEGTIVTRETVEDFPCKEHVT